MKLSSHSSEAQEKDLGKRIIDECIDLRRMALLQNLSHKSLEKKMGKFAGVNVTVLFEFENWKKDEDICGG